MELACKAGKIVLENGGEIYRVEETMKSICSAYEIPDCESFATPTIIMVSAPDVNGESYSRMMRITERGIDLNKVAGINSFARKLPIDVNDAINELERIEKSTPHPLWIRILTSSVVVGAFAFIFGGGIGDVFGGLVWGVLMRLVIMGLQKKHAGDFMVNFVGGATAAIGGWLVSQLYTASDPWIVTVSSMMLLVPGILFVNALRDIAAGDLVSGSSRGMEAISVAAALACGSAAVHAILALVNGGIL